VPTTTLLDTSGERLIGTSVRLKDAPKALIDKTTYVADIRLPALLYAAIYRSPYARTRINKIDLAAALALPGVVAPMSGNELPEFVKPMPGRGQETAAKNPLIQWPSPNCLAKDKVRFVGEAVAVLVTSDPRTSRRTRWS